MADDRQNDPDLANAIQAGLEPFMEAFMKKQSRAAEEKQRQIDVSWFRPRIIHLTPVS